jgi:hypothetical protein
MKTATKAILAGLLFEALLVGLFYLRPGAPLGQAIAMLHFPVLILINRIFLLLAPKTASTGAGFYPYLLAAASMWACWSALIYAVVGSSVPKPLRPFGGQ